MKIGEIITEGERKKLNVNARNHGIGRQFGELIMACYKMEASITKKDGRLVSVSFYKTGEKFMPTIEKGKVLMVMVKGEEDTYVEYTIAEFITKYRRTE